MKHQFTFLLLILLLIGCTSPSLSDGTYCAEVDRYSPKTGKQSNYILIVEIDDGKIVQMIYPNGGHTDSGEFNRIEHYMTMPVPPIGHHNQI